MTEPTQRQLEILQHTLGLRLDHRTSYRNHYVASVGHHSMGELETLEGAGLMCRAKTPGFLDEADILFMATDAGKKLAVEMLPPAPKRTRYDEFQNADCCESFAQFLGIKKPEIESRGPSWKRQEHRMFRNVWREYFGFERDVQGEWRPTKQDAKASYKLALAKHREAASAKSLSRAS